MGGKGEKRKGGKRKKEGRKETLADPHFENHMSNEDEVWEFFAKIYYSKLLTSLLD
jgi:hypothetical protein